MNYCAIPAELNRFPWIFITTLYLNQDWLIEPHNWRKKFNEASQIPPNKKLYLGDLGDLIRGLCGIGVIELIDFMMQHFLLGATLNMLFSHI